MELVNASQRIYNVFKNHPLVNKITTETISNIDYNKMSAYPLVNIELLDSYPGEHIQTFNFEIHIYQQRQIISDLNSSNDNDNLTDNFNECNMIAYSTLQKLRQLNDVDVVNEPIFYYLKNDRVNGLDGLRFLLSVQVAMDEPHCI